MSMAEERVIKIGMLGLGTVGTGVYKVKKEALIQALLLTILGLRPKVSGPQSGPFFKKLHEFI